MPHPVVVLAVSGLPGTGKSTLCTELGKQVAREPIGPYSESIVVLEEVPTDELALFLATEADPATGHNAAAKRLQFAFLKLREINLARAMRQATQRARESGARTIVVEDRGIVGDAAMALGVHQSGALSASEYAEYTAELDASVSRLRAEFGEFPYLLVNLRMTSIKAALDRCHRRGSAGEGVYDEVYFRRLLDASNEIVRNPPAFVTRAVHEDWTEERPVDTEADRAALPARAVVAHAMCAGGYA